MPKINPYSASVTPPQQTNPCTTGWPRNVSLLIAAAGLLTASALFPRFAYGPWGAELTYYSLISHNLRITGFPVVLLTAWPIAIGFLLLIVSIWNVVAPKSVRDGWNVATLTIGILTFAIPLCFAAVYGLVNATLPFASGLFIFVPSLTMLLLTVLGYKARSYRHVCLIGGWLSFHSIGSMLLMSQASPAFVLLLSGGILAPIATTISADATGSTNEHGTEQTHAVER